MENKCVRDEIPKTEQGLKTYIAYCEKAMKENLLHNRRLRKRMEWCEEDLAKIKSSMEVMHENNRNRF